MTQIDRANDIVIAATFLSSLFLRVLCRYPSVLDSHLRLLWNLMLTLGACFLNAFWDHCQILYIDSMDSKADTLKFAQFFWCHCLTRRWLSKQDATEATKPFSV